MKVRWPALVLLLLILGQTGCRHHYGPSTVTADRLPYNDAIAVSWKEQTLLNIVRLRYMDTPFFVDVPQMTSGYQVIGTASATAGIFPPASNLATFAQELGANLNLQAGYQDRPTISYTPQTHSQFIRNLTTPINPGSVMFLLQSGYPADVVFDLTVDMINGVRNRSVSGGQLRSADPEFTHIVQILRKAQLSGNVGIRVTTEKDKKDSGPDKKDSVADRKDSVAIFFQEKTIDPELAKELAEVRKILRLDPKGKEFKITFGGTAASPNEISILSRSVLRVLSELATFVEVPAEHLASGIAPPIGEVDDDEQPPMRVLSGLKKPHDPFTTICYEGQWFWIEKSDFLSKRTMAYLLVLLALADTGSKENLPVITIQAN
jgi:hypothetical protein